MTVIPDSGFVHTQCIPKLYGFVVGSRGNQPLVRRKALTATSLVWSTDYLVAVPVVRSQRLRVPAQEPDKA